MDGNEYELKSESFEKNPIELLSLSACQTALGKQAGWQGSGMLVAWAASVLAGALFYRLAEAPLASLIAARRSIGAL